MQEKSFGGLAARGPAAELTALPMQTECCIQGSESGSGERRGGRGTKEQLGERQGKEEDERNGRTPRFRNMDTPVELEEL